MQIYIGTVILTRLPQLDPPERQRRRNPNPAAKPSAKHHNRRRRRIPLSEASQNVPSESRNAVPSPHQGLRSPLMTRASRSRLSLSTIDNSPLSASTVQSSKPREPPLLSSRDGVENYTRCCLQEEPPPVRPNPTSISSDEVSDPANSNVPVSLLLGIPELGLSASPACAVLPELTEWVPDNALDPSRLPKFTDALERTSSSPASKPEPSGRESHSSKYKGKKPYPSSKPKSESASTAHRQQLKFYLPSRPLSASLPTPLSAPNEVTRFLHSKIVNVELGIYNERESILRTIEKAKFEADLLRQRMGMWSGKLFPASFGLGLCSSGKKRRRSSTGEMPLERSERDQISEDGRGGTQSLPTSPARTLVELSDKREDQDDEECVISVDLSKPFPNPSRNSSKAEHCRRFGGRDWRYKRRSKSVDTETIYSMTSTLVDE